MGQYDALKETLLGFSTLGAAALWDIPEARRVFDQFKQLLNAGLVRAAEKSGGEWVVNAWVKEGILLGMRLGRLQESHVHAETIQKIPLDARQGEPPQRHITGQT